MDKFYDKPDESRSVILSSLSNINEVNKKNFPYPLVRIYWEDIIGETNWSDIVDIKKSKTFFAKIPS